MSDLTDDEVDIDGNVGPRVSTVRAASLGFPLLRLDAKFFQDEFTLACARVAACGMATRLVRDLATAFVPGRAKLVTVPNEGAGAPYLKAHDAFMTRPESDRFVVAGRMRAYDSYLLRRGMILTPSSGRNLGPTAYVGNTLARFAMTDIMRILPAKDEDGFYLLAFLRTPTGQALMRRGRTGTNVDHLAPADVLDIPVVWPDGAVRKKIARQVRYAERLLDTARATLDALEREFHERAGLASHAPSGRYLASTGPRAFQVRSGSLSLRLDAESYSPDSDAARHQIRKSGAIGLMDAARLVMLGRYKRYYVSRDHGRPILSGTHLLQQFPVNLKAISDRSFSSPAAFVLKRGWTVFTCDGRAEEGLGSPAFVSSLWDSWMASNHVMRAIPRDGIQPGYLYLAMRSPYVQVQLKSRATGSVIDALDAGTVGDVLLPALDEGARYSLGRRAEKAWEAIAQSVRQTEATVSELEEAIVAGYERAA